MRKCPTCYKEFADDVVNCDVDQSVLLNYNPPPPSNGSPGWIFIFVGIAAALYFSFGYSTSVNTGSGPVVNLDLQQNQMLGFLASLAVFFTGLLMVLFSKLVTALEK